LSEDETLDLLANDPEYWEHFRQSAHHALPETDGQQTRRLPVVLWSRLYHDLEPYLSWRSADGTALMVFFHPRFNEVADRLFQRDDTVRRARHESLATYFRDLADPERNQSWKGESGRPFLELAFHLARANADELAEVLFDFNWLQAKTDKALVPELIQDYDEALRALPSKHPQCRALELVQGSIRLSAHVVSRDENQLASQLVARLLPCEEKELDAFRKDVARKQKGQWLRLIAPTLSPPGGSLVRIFECCSWFIRAVGVIPGGRQVVSACGETLELWDAASGQRLRTMKGSFFEAKEVTAVAVTPDGRQIVCVGFNCELQLWDLATGRCVRTLDGGWSTSLALARDGHLAICGCHDGTLKVWDLANAQCVRTLAGHTEEVTAVAVTPDGEQIVPRSGDKTLRVWDLSSGECLRTLAGHTEKIAAVAVTPDGAQVVSGAGDKALRVWDLSSGHCVRTLAGHTKEVTAVAITKTGVRLVSGSGDKTLRVWDLARGQCVRTLAGHTEMVTALALMPDGQQVVSAALDKTVRLWQLGEAQGLRVSEKHDGAVEALASSSDNRCVISGSGDKTLRIWDLASGHCVRTLTGHAEGVRALAPTPDGRLVLLC
jgi:WD40 repeat protein